MTRFGSDSTPDGPVLALDTATKLGSVAVGTREGLLAEITLGVEVRHSESLLPAVRFALERSRVRPGDLRAIIVGGGPGSFTGVRIAAATAKAMVLALDVPLFSYTSLALLAAGTGVPDRAVCALLDAHGDEVFAACHRMPSNGGLETVLEPSIIDVADLAARLTSDRPLWVGGAALRFASLLGEHGNVAGSVLAVPRASSLLWLAQHAPHAGRVSDPAKWTPAYLRPPGVTQPE